MAKKEVSIMMKYESREARNGNLHLKTSVRHIGNAFLNGVDMAQEKTQHVLY